MNAFEIGLLFAILGFQVFEFVLVLNIIKKVINSFQDRVHEMLKDEISILLNDRDLYDSLKDYLGSLGQGVIGKLQPRSSNNLVQTLIGTVLQRLVPGSPGEISKSDNSPGKTSKNPFTK
jgi:hypothetical protein